MKHWIFNEQHELLRRTTREFCRRHIVPHIDEWDRAGEFPRELFAQFAEAGFLGLRFPAEYGGLGADYYSSLVVAEEISYSGAESVAQGLSIVAEMVCPTILKFGSEEQKRTYLRPALQGERIAALAITEPNAGSDVGSIATRAERSGSDWMLSGQKTFITNGCRADFVLVVARTGPGNGHKGLSLFLVDRDLPGFQKPRKLEKLGRWASDTAELTFDSVRLPASALLGEQGKGFYHIMWELQAERLIATARAVAAGQLALDLAVRYVQQREQFGRRLSEFQALRHRLADMAARLEAARQLCYYAVWRYASGDYPVQEISMAKLTAAQALNFVADEALQMHGGYGYMREFPIERVWRDARLTRIGGGTDEIQREIIADRLLLPRA